MLRVVTRGFRRQLKLGVPEQPVHETIQSQKQLCYQVNKIQEFDAPNIEPEQLVTIDFPIHHIPTKHEEKKEPKVPLIGRFLTPNSCPNNGG
jgi:hypothetical protein